MLHKGKMQKHAKVFSNLMEDIGFISMEGVKQKQRGSVFAVHFNTGSFE